MTRPRALVLYRRIRKGWHRYSIHYIKSIYECSLDANPDYLIRVGGCHFKVEPGPSLPDTLDKRIGTSLTDVARDLNALQSELYVIPAFIKVDRRKEERTSPEKREIRKRHIDDYIFSAT